MAFSVRSKSGAEFPLTQELALHKSWFLFPIFVQSWVKLRRVGGRSSGPSPVQLAVLSTLRSSWVPSVVGPLVGSQFIVRQVPVVAMEV